MAGRCCSARRTPRSRRISCRPGGEGVGAQTVRSKKEGADPASVAFEALSKGIESEVDVVLIDTPGHLPLALMGAVAEVKQAVERHATVDEVLLVLDATTGQNGLRQARVFAEVVDVSGIALTQLDATAKGGIVIAIQRELSAPIKLVGLGAGPDDLAPFDPATFVDTILEASPETVPDGMLNQHIYPFDHPDGRRLHQALAHLYRPEQAKSLSSLAGLRTEHINFYGSAFQVWEDILQYAALRGQLRRLARVAMNDPESLSIRPSLERLLGG